MSFVMKPGEGGYIVMEETKVPLFKAIKVPVKAHYVPMDAFTGPTVKKNATDRE